MSEIIIRNHLKPGDIGYITYLHGKFYAAEFGYDLTFEAYVGELLAQCLTRGNTRERIWVVEFKHQVVGSIALCELSGSIAQLRCFLVESKVRGMGVGKKLVNTALSFARENAFSEVQLWTIKGLENARKLYITQGFSLIEESVHDLWGAKRTKQSYSLSL